MRVASLFSGAGGLDKGFIDAGHQIVWANDFAKDAVETYRLNIGDHIIHEDVSKICTDDIPDCDILIGGFPCQGFSLANLKRSVDDERNKLYLEFIRILKAKHPPFFVAENVDNLVHMDDGKVIRHIVNDFRSCGYEVDFQIKQAADFGTPQSRKRVFIVGTRKDIYKQFNYQFPEPTHRDNDKARSKIPIEMIERFDNQHWKNYIVRLSLPEVEKKDAQYEAKGALLELWKSAKYDQWVSMEQALEGIPEPDTENQLLNHIGSKYKITVKNFTGHRVQPPNRPCPTILARGNAKGGVVAMPHYLGLRRLTVRESARIQDFDDDFEFVGKMGSMYRQIGNAVPVRLAFSIASQFPLEVPTLRVELTVSSLFSGCGGMDLGFIEAGFEIQWANDNFEEAVETYCHNIGGHIVSKDVSEVQPDEIPNSTVMIGGFPCQGFSVANTGRNENDERNKLYLEFIRLIRQKRPHIFVAENVKGILSLGKGKVFEMIKQDFADAGYVLRHHLFNSANYGVPQKRERVFIVGVRDDLSVDWDVFPPRPTHSDHSKGTLSDLKPWVTVGQALSEIPDPDGEHDVLNHTYSKYKLRFNGHIGHRRIDPDKPSPTVTGRGDSKGGVVVLHHPNNERRMSVRELATVQDFPMDFEFKGNQSMAYRQIGNAVPRGLAKAVAESVRALIRSMSLNYSNQHVSADVRIDSIQTSLPVTN